MAQNSSSTSILIIEDEIAIAEGLVDLCELNGYSVKHVADGESGLTEALSGQYGLVLLDLMLPGMDGFTVCDKIREKDRSLPIIILSAKNADEDIINGLKFGARERRQALCRQPPRELPRIHRNPRQGRTRIYP